MKSKILFLMLLGIAGINSSCFAYTVSGVVRDLISGNPLSGVTLTVGGKSAVTNTNGNYLVVSVPAGNRTLRGSLTNYRNASKAIVVNANLTNQNLLLRGLQKILPVGRLAARRDTHMLCLDGCWRMLKASEKNHFSLCDAPRTTAKFVSDHDKNYCAHAASRMINNYYGGNLTQDELAFRASIYEGGGGTGVPELDIRHEETTPWDACWDGFKWALGNPSGALELTTLPSDADIKSYIDSNRPMWWGVAWTLGGAHVMVVSGYRFVDKRAQLRYLNIDNDGLSLWGTTTRVDNLDCAFYRAYVPPSKNTSGNIGITTDGLLALHSDSDGVSDFDERRRWNGQWNLDSKTADTDKDGLTDKKDIEGWLFLGHPQLPNGEGNSDSDGDGLRSEVDLDSDNGGVYDGHEDFNDDANRAAGETNPYAALRPNADDIPKVKISISTGKVLNGKRYVKGSVTATLTFYRKDGTTPLLINPNTSPLKIQYRPKGGSLVDVYFIDPAIVPTSSCTSESFDSTLR